METSRKRSIRSAWWSHSRRGFHGYQSGCENISWSCISSLNSRKLRNLQPQINVRIGQVPSQYRRTNKWEALCSTRFPNVLIKGKAKINKFKKNCKRVFDEIDNIKSTLYILSFSFLSPGFFIRTKSRAIILFSSLELFEITLEAFRGLYQRAQGPIKWIFYLDSLKWVYAFSGWKFLLIPVVRLTLFDVIPNNFDIVVSIWSRLFMM